MNIFIKILIKLLNLKPSKKVESKERRMRDLSRKKIRLTCKKLEKHWRAREDSNS